MPMSEEEKRKTITDDLELIEKYPDKYRLKLTTWDRPGRPKGMVLKPKIKTGVPEKEEWAEVSRIIFDNAKELLTDRDDEGRLTCSPALLTAVSKLVMESETVYKEPKKESDATLQKQLTAKRKKRKLRITEPEVIPLKKPTELNNFGDLGYVSESEQANPSVFHKEQPQDIN